MAVQVCRLAGIQNLPDLVGLQGYSTNKQYDSRDNLVEVFVDKCHRGDRQREMTSVV